MTGDNKCVQGATNETRIKSLEARVLNTETGIIEIRDKLLGRPTVPLMIIVSVLSSLCAGLITRSVTVDSSYKSMQIEFRELNSSLQELTVYLKSEK